jgi:hypothetical protein
MRGFLGVAVTLLLIASPAMAGAGGPGDSPAPTASASSAAAATAKGSADADAAPKADLSSLEVEIEELRDLLQSQSKQLQTQNDQLAEQQKKMQTLEDQLTTAKTARENLAAAPAPAVAGTSPLASSPVASSPVVLASSASTSAPAAEPVSASTPAAQGGEPDSPLQLRIGSAYITPVGFMDFTTFVRDHAAGGSIGTSFGSIPYGATAAGNHLSEFRESMQNSRIGFRVDALTHGAHVIGYMEADFLGNVLPQNVAVTSNSSTLRSRLYWVDVQKGSWEVLGGQTWSLITPGRTGISPLPGNIFFTNNIDVNYQAGLVWGRIPELRFVWHGDSNKVALAVALDNPEQYIGGSSGGGAITLPTNLAASATFLTPGAASGTAANANGEFNNGNTTLNVPNYMPDIIFKAAFDPSARVHVEVGGIYRHFRDWNPLTATLATEGTSQVFDANGEGAFLNLNFAPIKNLRILTNNYWSDGGGRYIFGQAPDLIVRADGSISPVKSASTVSGFEYTHKNTLFYGYYGGIYIAKNIAFDPALAGTGTPLKGGYVGYGFPSLNGGAAAGAGQNRDIQEITLGFNQTIWKDAKWGAVNLMGQYSYLLRDPWVVPNNGSPSSAHLNMAFMNLRYTLPGSAPTLGK